MNSVVSQEYLATNHEHTNQELDLNSVDKYVDRELVELLAHSLIERRHEFTSDYKTPKTYHDDARTALFEALTASGHLSVVKTSGSLEDIHQTMLQVLLGAYDDSLPEFEKQRRFQEICEEITLQSIESQIVNGVLEEGLEVATISDIPSQKSEVDLTKLGYRVSNKKGMVRSNRLVSHGDGTFTRISEQVSRSNSNAYVSRNFLYSQGFAVRQGLPIETAVLGTQLTHMSNGVLGIIKRLDHFSGDNIRYGEPANNQQIPYEQLKYESAKREAQAEFYIGELADYMQSIDSKLNTGEISEYQHCELLNAEIHRILQAICTLRPDYTESCFGGDVVQTYNLAAQLVTEGKIDLASDIIQQNEHKESVATFCGMSISTKEAAEKSGVMPSNLDLLIKLGLENWPTHIGVCQVPECVSPKPTEVGGCNICVGNCEPLFNKGWSLPKIISYYQSLNKATKKLTKKSVTIWDLFARPNKNSKNVRR